MRKIIGHRLNRNDTRFYVVVRDSEKKQIEVWEISADASMASKILKSWSFKGFEKHEPYPIKSDSVTESLARRNAEIFVGALSRLSEAPADAEIQTETSS